jgi:glutamate-1-semialdehyde 2,1-aminomutase
MLRKKSKAYFAKAEKLLVGGVNSPVRAFKSVGGTPVVFARAKGPYFWDLDGHRYIDYVMSWGPLLLGHAAALVLKAIHKAALKGTSYGACHELELALALKIRSAMPSMEKIRFVSSGTEATLSALRLARGFTGRSAIVKFEGCYHGHGDSLLVKAGSGVATLKIPDSLGVTPGQIHDTLTLPYNDIPALRELFATRGQDIAALIVEPVVGNMGMVLPQAGFLKALRKETQKAGALLIFDEVMTGFRVGPGGAQEIYKIKPDLTCLGKAIGGGLPVGAFGGRAEIMNFLAPLGPVYQAGTLSGNPLAMAAGLATLSAAAKSGFYSSLEKRMRMLCDGWATLFEKYDISAQILHLGGMFGIYFSERPVLNFEDAKSCDTGLFVKFFNAMLDEGIYLAPSAFEAGFISSAHNESVILETLARTERALKKMRLK